MLGYQGALAAGANPFVTGVATVSFSLPDNQVDVLFSDVTSRDGRRTLADFGFTGLRPQAGGTFAGGGRAGMMDGAFLGPDHAEAAGAFHHNATHVTGSFGARRLPDTVTLEASGTYRRLEGTDGAHFYAYDGWGFWGRQFQENVFGAFVDQTIRKVGLTTYYDATFGRLEGTPSGNNPVAGPAVWSGQVNAFDTHADDLWTPVRGTARLEVDFAAATLDVALTDFENGHPDLSWPSLRLHAGAFAHTQGRATLEGAFYGRHHQGAAGKFTRGPLRGIFGAIRQ